MQSGTQARADWRVLVSAAVIGSSVGVALGAAYMAGGMSSVAADHSRASRIAEMASGQFSDTVLLTQTAGDDAGVLRLAQAHDPFARGGEADRDRRMVMAGLQGAEMERARTKITKQRELECLTQAVYFEARGESQQGQAAVAQVVMNRVKAPGFPKTVCGVVFQGAARSTGCQFSFACDGSMRRRLEGGAWQRARKVAARAMAGVALADIGSATHFHTTAVSPVWGPQMKRVGQVGLHVFYRFNPRAKPNQPMFVSAPSTQNQTLRLSPALVQGPIEAPSAAQATAAEPAKAPMETSLPEAAAPNSLTKAADAVATVATETTAS